MFKTIVVGLDGSKGSEPAMALASRLAKDEQGRIVVVHVEEDVVGKGGGPIHATEDEIQAEIRKQAEQLGDQGIDTKVKMKSIMVGGPAHPIAEVADEENADVIVVGTRGHSPVAGLLLGSVTQRLLHLAHQPVLVAPNGSAH
jgi:nucleotide-binding universal stress UspA family protein